MTFATKITMTRMLMAPVFAIFANRYSLSVQAGATQEHLRWTAVLVFFIASISDGLDGWIARRFNQKSKFGAFIDPFADKVLLLTGIIFLSAFPWGGPEWRIPPWFVALVIGRDVVIIIGIIIIRRFAGTVHYQPHWSGKMSTLTQIVVLGWVMLKIPLIPALYVCCFSGVFVAWSAITYILEGVRQLQHPPQPDPQAAASS